MKALVIYYSLTGKTELVGKAIAKTLGAETEKIEETKRENILFRCISGAIQAAKGKGSVIKPLDVDINNYEFIFIGTPVWAFRPTPAINTFISQTDFKNKKIVLFVTMAGTKVEKAVNLMKEAIESKGGEVIGSFSIRTGGVKKEQIIEEGIKIATLYKDKKE
uniref:Flavodoxin n=1 Tax=candidate division WOR-3 bacterium TaxID=2052148 RepID=A0A7V3ZUQ9_UNCW3